MKVNSYIYDPTSKAYYPLYTPPTADVSGTKGVTTLTDQVSDANVVDNMAVTPKGVHSSTLLRHTADRQLIDGSGTIDIQSKVIMSGVGSEIPAAYLTGTISVDRLPKQAMNSMHAVETSDAASKLTISDVQNGDIVYVSSSQEMFYVYDETKLSDGTKAVAMDGDASPYRKFVAGVAENATHLNGKEEGQLSVNSAQTAGKADALTNPDSYKVGEATHADSADVATRLSDSAATTEYLKTVTVAKAESATSADTVATEWANKNLKPDAAVKADSATTAAKLSKTLALTGAVTGQASLNADGDTASIATTVSNGAVALSALADGIGTVCVSSIMPTDPHVAVWVNGKSGTNSIDLMKGYLRDILTPVGYVLMMTTSNFDPKDVYGWGGFDKRTVTQNSETYYLYVRTS